MCLYLVSLTVFLISVYNYRNILDADMSSELILGKLLASENKFFITKSWAYSTQLRFLDIQFIYGILFRFMNNWTHVHITCILLVNALFMISLYWFCSTIDKKDLFFILGSVYFLPICYDVIYFYYIALLYLVYLIYSLVILSLIFNYIKKNNNIYLILILFSSIIFSLEGIRIMIVVFIPLIMSLVISTIIKKSFSKDAFILLCYLTIGSLIGYAANKYVLSRYLVSMSVTPNSLKTVFSFSLLFRYIECLLFETFNKGIVYVLLSIFIVLLSLFCVFYNLKKCNDLFIVIFSLFYFFILFFVSGASLFSNIGIRTRYLLQATMYAVPVIVLTLSNVNNHLSNNMILLILLICVSFSVNTYKKYFSDAKPNSLEYISNKLIDEGYLNGYSTYWESNLLTELSNGVIDVWNWGDIYDIDSNFKNIDKIYLLLQKVSHNNTRPQGKCFVLLNDYYRSLLVDLQWYFNEDDILFEESGYTIYGFDSAQELYEIVNGMRIN